MKLYEINEEIENSIFNGVDENGEISEELYGKIVNLELDKDNKIKNIALLVKNLTAEKAAIDCEIDILKRRSVTLSKKHVFLKNYIDVNTDDDYRVEHPNVVISKRKSQSVEILDELKIPINLFIVTTTTKPNKAEILKSIKQGIEIEGCQLQTKFNLQIK